MTRPPDPAAPDLAERALKRRKRADAAVAVPLIAALLLVSPVVNLVAGGRQLAGVPLGYVWIFTAWAGLILVTRALARRLLRDTDPG